MAADDGEGELRLATRKLLFRTNNPQGIPGAGTSAAAVPERHLRVKVTMNLDGDVVRHFKELAQKDGRPYQTLINQALRDFVEGSKPERMAREISEILLQDEGFLRELANRISRFHS